MADLLCSTTTKLQTVTVQQKREHYKHSNGDNYQHVKSTLAIAGRDE
jgi:hypothetical protein